MKIIKNSLIYVSVSFFFIVLSVFYILFWKLNLWIDMTWWIQLDYDYKNVIDINLIKDDLKNESDKLLIENSKVINDISVYKITWEKTISVVVWFYNNVIDWKRLEEVKNNFRLNILEILKKHDNSIIEIKYINIWKSFWDYIRNTAVLTLIIAIIAISIYLTYAFSGVITWISLWSYSVITIITLFHDVIISTWAYIFVSWFFPEFKIDTFFITALLTILWYSINDTIVVFDRIRWNLKAYWWRHDNKWQNLEQIVDTSINETLTRSLYTSLTLIFVLMTIFIFWPESIKGFVLVMMFWTFVWTYSSIFIASPILYLVNKNKTLKIYKKEIINPQDKIVV